MTVAPRGLKVPVTWEEVALACQAGCGLRIKRLQLGSRETWERTQDNGWEREIVGALGEWVVAKAADRYPWTAERKDRANGDVGGWQVRASRRYDADLCVYPNDPGDKPFILVVGQPPTFFVPGWLWGHEAKQDRFWHEAERGIRIPAFFAPQAELHAFETLDGLW